MQAVKKNTYHISQGKCTTLVLGTVETTEKKKISGGLQAREMQLLRQEPDKQSAIIFVSATLANFGAVACIT
jgi:hypothetical protein